ncbi:AEC family transporter [Brevibacterium picturae]|uniref:AEC family transporter n=1 Tax=Brevibacterium picturae TaxID=260553 RepID=A0ABP4ME16_9MICO
MSLIPVLLALVPVAALILLGIGLRRLPGFTHPEFWSGAEKLAYYCLLPVLLFSSVAEVSVSHVPLGRLAVGLIAPTAVVSILIIVLRRYVAPDLPSFTSVLQGGIRFNTYIGLSISASLFGSEGSALAAIVAAVLVPTVNIVSSLGFEFLRTGTSSALGIVRVIITNPLVIGCAAGGLFNLTGAQVPDVVDSVLSSLAAAALPIGLLCVGAGLRRFPLRTQAAAMINSTAAKLLVLPAVTLLALVLLDVPTTPALVAIIFQSIATASSGFVMARQLGGNSELMAALIGAQTVLMLLTLPPVLLISQAVLGA